MQHKQHSAQHVVGGGASEGGSAAEAAGGSADIQQGPATEIFVTFQKVDKDGHKDRSTHPPTENTPESEELLKQVLIATPLGKQAKAAELISNFARVNGTQGVAPHILFSLRSTIPDAVAAGTYGFAGPGSAESGGLTVQISGSTAPKVVGFILFSPFFS